jgi:hypothetical protein
VIISQTVALSSIVIAVIIAKPMMLTASGADVAHYIPSDQSRL